MIAWHGGEQTSRRKGAHRTPPQRGPRDVAATALLVCSSIFAVTAVGEGAVLGAAPSSDQPRIVQDQVADLAPVRGPGQANPGLLAATPRVLLISPPQAHAPAAVQLDGTGPVSAEPVSATTADSPSEAPAPPQAPASQDPNPAQPPEAAGGAGGSGGPHGAPGGASRLAAR